MSELLPMKFRKRPVVIEAVQWLGNMPPVIALVGHDLPTFGEGRSGSLRIVTLEGDHEVSPGDWIIKGIMGECYPCKPDIFEATYQPASEDRQPYLPHDDVAVLEEYEATGTGAAKVRAILAKLATA